MKDIIKLSKYVKGYWKEAVITWLSVFVECIAEVLVAFFMQYVLNNVQGLIDKATGEFVPEAMNAIILYSCLVASMAIIAAVTGIIAGIFAATAAAGFGKNLREAIFTHIQDYSFKNIDKFSTSSLVTRITTDVTNVQGAFQMIIRMVVRAPLIMTFALVMCFVTYWPAALIFLGIVPVVFVALILIANKAHPVFVRVFEAYDDLNEAVSQDVDGIRVVKSFNREKLQKEKFGGVSGFIYKNFKKAEKRVALNGPILNLAIYGAIIAISAIMCNAILKVPADVLGVGSLSTMITYVMMIMMSLMMISMVYVTLIIGKNSTVRILEALEEEPDIKNPENPITEVPNGEIEFKNVDFGYHKNKNVLTGVNQKVESGKTIGILGSTGSSKTTLVSLIARLFDVTEGEVLVGGHNVKEYDLKVLRDSVAVVLQKNTLFSGTIRENLLWGNESATEEEIAKACEIAQVTSFLKDLPNGLETKLDEGGTNVSGGQKQRLCIARALLKNPKILILDDSTSACDTHTDALIREGLQKYRPDVTKFIIAQRVLSVKECDEIWVMNEGRILETGDNATLMKTSKVYKELFDSQNGGGDFDAAN
ncbi:MAG: ABC transporter ATP-binding protein/permease [Bacilli bacterium]|nr:ABC transporter ATP-binding protein/permease [Bacilli bacterium]